MKNDWTLHPATSHHLFVCLCKILRGCVIQPSLHLALQGFHSLLKSALLVWVEGSDWVNLLDARLAEGDLAGEVRDIGHNVRQDICTLDGGRPAQTRQHCLAQTST